MFITELEMSQKLGNEDSGVGLHLEYVVIEPSSHCCVETKEWHLVVICGCTHLCQLERNIKQRQVQCCLNVAANQTWRKCTKYHWWSIHIQSWCFRGEVSEIENTKLQAFFDFNRYCKLKIECRPEITKKITGFLILSAWCPMSADGGGHLLSPVCPLH